MRPLRFTPLVATVAFAFMFITITASTTAHAAFVDPMDNTDYFSAPFGDASVTPNGSTVTLSKTDGFEIDSGVIWSDLAAGKIPLVDSIVTITPYEPADNDYINIQAIYFDVSDAYIGQSLVLPDTNQETPILFDVAPTAPVTAASYVLQIRILPYSATEAEFTFDSIATSAIPEPASFTLAALGGLLLLKRRR